MRNHKKMISIVIYANPDDYPPTMRAVDILSKEFDIIIICRNQNKAEVVYPDNVGLYRLGKLKTSREKESQGRAIKVFEYMMFVLRVIFYIRFYRCKLIYSYDMHGFIAGFLASRYGRNIPLFYHNHELSGLGKVSGLLSHMIKYLEISLAHRADRVIFPDINRARFFQAKAKLAKFPDIVMNTPLRVDNLPPNRLKKKLEMKGIDTSLKTVLYQGAINETSCALELVESIVFWPKNTILILMGRTYVEYLDRVYARARALNLDERIIHLAFMPYSELSSYTVGAYLGLALFKSYDINRIFVAGASNKIFEYLSMGTPVVTNDSPYFKEVLDSSYAYFAQPDSPEDIGRTINSVFSDDDGYRKKCQAARQAHLTKLNYQEQFRPIVEYIREFTERMK